MKTGVGDSRFASRVSDQKPDTSGVLLACFTGKGAKRWGDDVPDALFRRSALSDPSNRFIAKNKILDQHYQNPLTLTQPDGSLVPSVSSTSAINHASYGYQQVNPTKHYERAKTIMTNGALRRGYSCKHAPLKMLVTE